MRVDIDQIDRQMAFLARQEKRLRELRPYFGASTDADMFQSIHETLRQVRQAQQMTGMDGRPIS